MSTPFKSTDGSWVSINEARTHIQQYQASNQYQENNKVKAIYYGKDKLESLLAQDGCMGLRAYFGLRSKNGKNLPALYFVGCDEDGNDMLEASLVLDLGRPCPTDCPPKTKLG